MSTAPIIGIDLGYGRIKVAGPGYRYSFPAVVSEPSTWSEPTNLVEWGEHRFLVGEAALAEPHHRYSVRPDKIGTPEEMAKFLAALAHASRHYDTSTLTVATGLPPAHYRDPGLKAQLTAALSGTFRFRYECLPREVTVVDVSVDPQAGAAFFDFLRHDDGELADTELLNMRTIVLDPGHKTTDVALMQGNKAAQGSRSLLTVEQGVWHVYEEVARLLQRQHRLSLTAAEIDAYWRSTGSLWLSGRSVSLEPLFAEAIMPVARTIMAGVARLAGDLRLWEAVLLVGGGGTLFEPVFAAEFGLPVRLAKGPEFSNAAGYFKRQMARLRV